MPETVLHRSTPVTLISEDETLFRDTVRQFAEDKIRPHVKHMDEKGVFERSLLDESFQLGLMGIEIPESYGGSGGRFFEAILPVGGMLRRDASAGVVVDVADTLVNKGALRWGSEAPHRHQLLEMG